MSAVTATAPGKVVLLGEYAVLDGAPALSLAVDRRARVSLQPCKPHECAVAAPQLGIDPVGFSMGTDGQIQWQGREADGSVFERTARLFESLLEQAVGRFGDPGAFRLRIDTGPLYFGSDHGPVKLGLGSSAAVAVALDAAIRRFAGGEADNESPRTRLGRLLGPYRSIQRGHGSGIDLATSLFGGLIGYQIEAPGGRNGQSGDKSLQVCPLRLPADFAFLFVWTGEAASTTDLVSDYRRWCARHRADSGRIHDRMSRVGTAGRTAVERGDGRALVEQVGAYGQIMGTMTNLAKVSVLTSAHREAMALAERLGAAYKPCGAGGGDIGMAASTDPAKIARLADDFERAGLHVLALKPDAQGVCVRDE